MSGTGTQDQIRNFPQYQSLGDSSFSKAGVALAAACPLAVRHVHNRGFVTVPNDHPASSGAVSLRSVLASLEEQLAALDKLGARVAAAHVSAAVEHLRLDLLDERLGDDTTRH